MLKVLEQRSSASLPGVATLAKHLSAVAKAEAAVTEARENLDRLRVAADLPSGIAQEIAAAVRADAEALSAWITEGMRGSQPATTDRATLEARNAAARHAADIARAALPEAEAKVAEAECELAGLKAESERALMAAVEEAAQPLRDEYAATFAKLGELHDRLNQLGRFKILRGGDAFVSNEAITAPAFAGTYGSKLVYDPTAAGTGTGEWDAVARNLQEHAILVR